MTNSNKKDDFVFFWGGSFSNFSEVSEGVEYKGKIFPTSEHAFMYGKALQFKDLDIAKQLETAKTPKDAKRLGRKVKGYDDEVWSDVRYEIMKEVCLSKYTRSPYHKRQLLNTGTKELVEASPYDKVWGIGMSKDDNGVEDRRNWKGENLLGKVLMEVREEIK